MSMVKCKECGKEISSTAKTCPNCGAKKKKEGLGLGGIFLFGLVTFIAIIVICSKMIGGSQSAGTGTSTSTSRLSESSPEYQRLVYDHMKVVTDDPEIGSMRVNGSILYIDFIKPQKKNEYQLVAKMNAIKFSNFKKEKLGVSGVTVYCTYKGNTYAQANARGGQITSLR